MAEALKNCLISPNESDSNFEPANVVDGLFAIARSLQRIADQLQESLQVSLQDREE